MKKKKNEVNLCIVIQNPVVLYLPDCTQHSFLRELKCSIPVLPALAPSNPFQITKETNKESLMHFSESSQTKMRIAEVYSLLTKSNTGEKCRRLR